MNTSRCHRHACYGSLLASAALIFLGVVLPAPLKAWTPSFREFGGVNNSGTTNLLFAASLSFEREPAYWSSLAPASNTWDANVLTNLGTNVMAYQAQSVQYLPLLGYTAEWAADKSARSWTNGSTIYSVVPHTNDSNMDYFIYVNGVLNSQSVLTDFSKFPPVNVSDWSNYVYRVAAFLHAPPFNVQYFQVWNEAYYTGGFWYGGMNEYIQKIHLPAAQAIHAVGGKVVYGGWPDVALPGSLLSLLDANNAWSSVDALDLHYFNVGDVQTLRAGANARGYTNIAIWQTEIGFTSDYTFIPNYFARALFWNLTNNWTRDKYRVFYFADWAPNDPAAFGYNDCLWSGSALNGSGLALTNLACVLGGTNQLRQFPGVTSSPALYPQIWPATSSLEAFSYLTNVAVVISLSRTDYTNNSTVSLYLPIPPDQIASATRVDLSGEATNVTGQITTNGAGAQLTVSTRDAPGSPAQTWNAASSSPLFYLLVRTAGTNLALNRPAASSSIENASYPPSNAVDGNLSTRWSSAYSDPQWLSVDLGATYDVSRVTLNWEAAYARSYQIQISPDNLIWTTIYTTTNGTGGVNALSGLSGTGRYVRMYGTQRATVYGYSLYELQVFGSPPPPLLRLSQTGNALSLSWPAGGNFVPWSATNLMPPVSWIPLTNPIQCTGTLTITVTPSAQSQFFQLRPQ